MALTTNQGQELNESELIAQKADILKQLRGIRTNQAKAILTRLIEEIDESSIVCELPLSISEHGNT